MSRLNELKAKYPGVLGIKYPPNPECIVCSGTGERVIQSTGRESFCICLFVNHRVSNFAAKSLKDTVTKLQQELSLVSQ